MKPLDRRTALLRRKSSTPHYQTFDTIPPRSRGKPLSASSACSTPVSASRSPSDDRDPDRGHGESPLPKTQMAILAVIALCEQTALNSISPYLPNMVASFPDMDVSEIGIYVGTIASAFALAQLATNFFWGWLSDQIGRKPVILTGTILTSACFVAFGFCRNLQQAILVQAFMGTFNGNQAVVSTCLGEITDRSNQSRAFTYLPVIYGLGAITGPIIGGLLVLQRSPFDASKVNPYPFLGPNLFAAALLLIDFVATTIFLEESLEEARDLPPLSKRVKSLFAWMWQFTSSSTRPTYLRKNERHLSHRGLLTTYSDPEELSDVDEEDDVQTFFPALSPDHPRGELTRAVVLKRDTVLLLLTYLIFQLSNISYNALYPIFASAPPPTGRDLSPGEIGLTLGFAGMLSILFQVGLFGRLRDKMGNRYTFRVSLAVFVVAFLMTPWVGYKDVENGNGGMSNGRAWLWVELGFVLLVKTVAAVGGLTSALLLITNSAPSHAVLGTVNGLAQTLSAAGRAVGPFLSGSLFTVATGLRTKGEVSAFGVFGGVAFVGFVLSFGIQSEELEAEGWDDHHSQKSGSEED